MKYLIVVLVVVIVAWWLLRGRSRPGPGMHAAAPSPQPLQVVACRHCGVHLPRSECVEAPDGVYCCEGHRLAGPRSE